MSAHRARASAVSLLKRRIHDDRERGRERGRGRERERERERETEREGERVCVSSPSALDEVGNSLT